MVSIRKLNILLILFLKFQIDVVYSHKYRGNPISQLFIQNISNCMENESRILFAKAFEIIRENKDAYKLNGELIINRDFPAVGAFGMDIEYDS